MPAFNATKAFSDAKKTTKPVFKIPKSVKEALQVDEIFSDGTFRVEPDAEDALYDRCYVFEDINYITKDSPDKVSILNELMNFLKNISSQQKFVIASEHQDMRSYMDEIFSPVNKERYPELEDGIGQYICQKIDEGNRNITKTLYLVCTCRADSHDSARQYFNTLEVTLEGFFSVIGSSLYRLGCVERLALLQRMLNLSQDAEPVTGERVGKASHAAGKDAWKDIIMPFSISSREKDCLEIENRYCCVMCASNYDQKLNDEKVIHSIIDNAFPVYVTVDMQPVSKSLLIDRLNAAHTNNETKMATEREKNNRNGQYAVGPSYQTQRKNDEIEALLDKVDANDEGCLFIGFLCMTYADSIDELISRTNILSRIAKNCGYALKPVYYQQLKALNTLLPIGGRHISHMRPFLSSSAVAFNPFRAKDLKDDGGFILGMNCRTRQLIRLDRKKLKSPHGMICGHTGGGKSFFVKTTELAQSLLLTDDDVIVIDPQNEFQAFCEDNGGSYFDLTPQCSIYLNPLEVPRHIWDADAVEKNKFIATKCNYVNSFIAACMANTEYTTDYENAVYDATYTMYDIYFTKLKYGDQPTLRIFRDTLLDSLRYRSDADIRRGIVTRIAETLRKYIDGVFDMFSHFSNLDMGSRLIGFGIKKIPEDAWEPVMVTIMHYVSQRMEYNQDHKVAARLIVDETQVMCKKSLSASQLLYAIETYRKFGGIVTLVIQNLKHVLEDPDLRDMFSNCGYKVFFDQGGVDARALSEIQEFSGIEYKALSEAVAGKGVMCCEDQVILFDSVMSKKNPVYGAFSTNFHEKKLLEDGAGQEGGSI